MYVQYRRRGDRRRAEDEDNVARAAVWDLEGRRGGEGGPEEEAEAHSALSLGF
jgi:hypothetical protein